MNDFEQVIETFRGRSRRLVAVMFLLTAIWAGFAAASAYEFFQAEGVRAMIAWAGGYGLGLLNIALLQIWYWIEQNKNAVAREVKRVELLVTRVAGQMKTSE
jgi:hypothetical protein